MSNSLKYVSVDEIEKSLSLALEKLAGEACSVSVSNIEFSIDDTPGVTKIVMTVMTQNCPLAEI